MCKVRKQEERGEQDAQIKAKSEGGESVKLIDVDALDDAFTALRWRGDELLHWGDRPNWCLIGEEVEKLIADAPTIDAIPVGWLEKQADYARSEWDYDTCEGIRIVLKAWQKEQEAR